LRARRLRTSPAFDLIPLDRLTPVQRQALDAVQSDDDCFGVLCARGEPSRGVKSVSRDTALLWYALQTPGTLPEFAVRALGSDCDDFIARMVLDGVFEIECDGQLRSGPAAHAALFGNDGVQPAAENIIAVISRRAIEYAFALETENVAILSTRLYAYNRVPASPRWFRAFPDDESVERFLGIGTPAWPLAWQWQRLAIPPEQSGWIAWSRTGVSARSSAYKLYVSPHCASMRDALRATAGVVAASAAFHWKIGRDVFGLLRPDKCVVYFNDFADMQSVAAALATRLQGCPAQGTPFSAEFAGDGLLSWGVDPEGDPAGRQESWREYVCNRLATALAFAKTSPPAGVSPVRFALDRLRLDGIDPSSWAPAGEFFR
jgi:hypothetical protein